MKMTNLPPRTFLLIRVANGWAIRLFRLGSVPIDTNAILLDDVHVAKDLDETIQIIGDLSGVEWGVPTQPQPQPPL